MSDWVLTLSCADRVGVVADVSGFLARSGCNITESQQYGDPTTSRFFMRVRLQPPAPLAGEPLRQGFGEVAQQWEMDWSLHDPDRRDRVLLLCSREGHCLNDLLYRFRAGTLPGEVVAVASNHTVLADLVASYAVPFHHIPVGADTKPAAEAALLDLVAQHDVDLVVLARYMQILSAELCQALAGRCINIHHSFLPGFRGARPYRQARERGVKLIGATAHYVTADLDEGPIIEQDVERVDHSLDETELAAVGRDVECVVLARAVRWHLERRVLVDGRTTVVFR